MTLTWGGWTADPSSDPGDPATYATPQADWYERFELAQGPGAEDVAFVAQPGMARAFAIAGAPGAVLPFPKISLPRRALPPGANALPVPQARTIAPGDLAGPPPRDAVIVGVIDAGIALAHERFRRAGGTGTRILSAWSQGGAWAGQAHLPFGREVMQTGLDAAMAAANGAFGVDEGAVYRSIGLVDAAHPASERWTETDAPHGTHVADLAAGFDPFADGTPRDRMPMIVVELAPRRSVGPSGSFLEFYVIWAIRHIVETADVIWAACHPGTSGFPVVINLSYGLLAGPKDGTMPIQKYVADLNRRRTGRAPVVLMLPAGNDNLARGAAELSVPKGRSRALDWRLQPEDRTSSYAEIWGDDRPGPIPAHARHPLAITLATPGGRAGPGTAGRAGQYCDLVWTRGSRSETLARIYCRASDDAALGAPASTATRHRLVYVLCAAPTWRLQRRAAPAGAWTITLSAPASGKARRVSLFAQSDQDPKPGHGIGLISYFDDPDHDSHDAAGRTRDSYAVDPVTLAVTETFGAGVVQRRNTMNAIAGSAGSLTVAGYAATDGAPAAWSGSGRGTVDGSGHPAPDLAAVSDDGIWRLGRLAAGARSGSAVVMQGTSFATAEATRIAALAMLGQRAAGVAPQNVAVGVATMLAGAGAPAYPVPATAMPVKLGQGRLAMQDHGRVAR